MGGIDGGGGVMPLSRLLKDCSLGFKDEAIFCGVRCAVGNVNEIYKGTVLYSLIYKFIYSLFFILS